MKRTPKPRTQWPFPTMAVGESFIVPKGLEHSARSQAHYHGKKTGRRFVCRTLRTRMHVWRLK